MIEFVAEAGSTNADLAARLNLGEGLAEGVWLVADRQTAGRGRQGRTWFDGKGNFMGSTVVYARPHDPPLHTLALIAGLAVQEIVSARLAPPARALLKWPNDVLIAGAKLAGILMERAGPGVVIGIGVNLSVAPEVSGRETIALTAFGPAPDRDLFARDLEAAFASELERWRLFGLDPIIARWANVAHPVGTPLIVGEVGEQPLTGQFGGLDGNGALILRLADGTTQTVHAGEVRIAPLA